MMDFLLKMMNFGWYQPPAEDTALLHQEIEGLKQRLVRNDDFLWKCLDYLLKMFGFCT